MERPIFILVPQLDEQDFTTYLRDRGWRLLHDATQPFDAICYPPDEAPGGCGYRLEAAVLLQVGRDLHAAFLHLELQRYPSLRAEPPTTG